MAFRSGQCGRWIRGAVVALAGLSLGGCLYWRLLQFQDQLADFDQNFTVDAHHGLTLGFRHPVLLTDDLAWFGFFPRASRAAPHGGTWLELSWDKLLPPDAVESHRYEFTAEVRVDQDHITAVVLPEQSFGALPKFLLIDALRSLGRAQVDKTQRTLSTSLASVPASSQAAPPTRAQITGWLGRPYTQSQVDGRVALEYRFRQDSADPRVQPIIIHLSFDPATQRLLALQAQVQSFHLTLNFSPPPANHAHASP